MGVPNIILPKRSSSIVMSIMENTFIKNPTVIHVVKIARRHMSHLRHVTPNAML
jgi:hypothetical protein